MSRSGSQSITETGREESNSNVDKSTSATASLVGAGFRADIQGLRAIAVVSVVLAHAGVPGTAGGFIGVDLFFVLSGFLITGLLIREREKRGRISLLAFWSRRARRLLPASSFVLVSTAVACFLFLPVRWSLSAFTDIMWSAFFVANWRFAITKADYFAANDHISPLLHFWSLGVEEQYYFVWPFLTIAAGSLAVILLQKRPMSFRAGVALASVLVVVGSFAYSLWVLQTNQPLAYFSTPSRVWQLALGAFLAAIGPVLTAVIAKRRWWRHGLAFAGAIGFVSSVVLLAEKEAGHYPGFNALVPTLSAALLIVAGTDGARHFGTSLLETRAMQWLGDVSYSLYLWHFPILVIGFYVFDPAGWLVKSGLIAGSLLLSGLTYRWIEMPARTSSYLKSRPAIALVAGAVLIFVAAGTATALSKVTEANVGTIVNNEGVDVHVRPSLLNPIGNWQADAEGCRPGFDDKPIGDCQRGDAQGDKHAFLLGDSLAANIFGPMIAAAKAEEWQLSVFGKAGCYPADVTTYHHVRKVPYKSCDRFREQVIEKAITEKADIVFLIGGRNDERRVVDRESGKVLSERESVAVIEAGWRSTIERFTDHGIHVVVIESWPKSPENPVECLLETQDARLCSFEEAATPRLESIVASQLDNTELLNLDHHMCTGRMCRVVDGDILIYRDWAHLTEPFARRLVTDFRKVLNTAS